ncbi:MAG: hypothetical protein O6909_09370, partial [Alphaproteobacteria bacterium]|nr:hypothetical protein [Alphaproteobacteria bacterium]
MADTDTSEDEILDEDADEAASDAASAKSGKRKLILFALIGLLVVGAAAGGWFVFFAGDDSTVAAEGEPPVIVAPRKLAYIDLEPIFIQVESSKGKFSNVVIELALEVEEGSDDARRVVH